MKRVAFYRVSLFMIMLTPVFCYSQGATMSDPIIMGSGSYSAGTYTYSDSRNTSGYGNDYGQASPDIFYKFNVNGTTTISVSTCGSGWDTYLWILDANGNYLADNDDYGSACPGTTASIVIPSNQTPVTSLAAGTYYIVAEGWSTYAGVVNLSISLTVQGQVNYDTKNFIRTWEATAPQTDANALLTSGLREVKQATIYFDGLGRPEQSVVKKGSLITSSGENADVVTPFEYDQFGREVKKYLPYVAATGDGLFKDAAVSSQIGFYTGNKSPIYGQGENTFYAKIDYEPSPLNRITKQMAAGANWAGNGLGISTGLWVNTELDNVRIWNTWDVTNDLGSYTSLSTYLSGKLYKTATIDEQGKEVIEFMDKEGKLILKKVQLDNSAYDDGTMGKNHSGWLCTYYIYDDLSQLRCVIQPKAVELMNNANSWVLTPTMLNELCFRYEYDPKGRMIMKKVPGAEPVYMVYDKRDRLSMSQDENLKSKGKWLVTVYDELNRPIQTGLWNDAHDWLYHSAQAANSASYFYPFALLNPAVDQGTPRFGWELLTTTQYDNYEGSGGSLSNSGYGAYLTASSSTPDFADPIIQSTAVKGMVTRTSSRVLGTNDFISTINIYDSRGRVIQTQSVNVTSGLDVLTTQYSFSGLVLRSHMKHEKAGTNPQVYNVATKYTYDDLGRITSMEKNVNGVGWKQISSQSYDALGQLQTKNLSPAYNSNQGLEELRYDYNIRGWMLGMNRDYVKDANSSNYFGFDLGYDKNGVIGSYAPLYNGNISGTVWKSKGDGEKRKYDFSYDNVSRLKTAIFTQWVAGSGTSSVFNTSAGLNFSLENLTYDANGNIKTMWQKGWTIAGSEYIDKLSYHYLNNEVSNKLMNVVDDMQDKSTRLGDFRYSPLYEQTITRSKSANATDYFYDGNGNLVKDLNKDIETFAGANGIEYNHLNLPQKVTVKANSASDKGSIEYIYDATGVKLKKIVREVGKEDRTTLYLFGTYENDELEFLPMEEGRIRWVKANPYYCPSVSDHFEYDYFIKDHLGNVRMVLTEQGDNICYPAATLEADLIDNEKKLYHINDDPVNGQVRNVSEVGGASLFTQFQKRFYETNGSPGFTGKKTGLGIVLKVMAGDKVSIYGQSYYNLPPSGRADNNYMTVTELLGALVRSKEVVGSKGAISEAQVNNIGINANEFNNIIQSVPPNNTANAWINYIVFDDQMKCQARGADPVNTNGGYKSHDAFFAANAINILKNGYIYVFVSNESNYPVYFDNLAVTHTPGHILEETHYYPFGLTMAGISSKAAGGVANRFKYNDKEEQRQEFTDGSGLEWLDYGSRMYDVQIGRWTTQDPMAGKYFSSTPYNYVDGNPIVRNDPNGEDWFRNEKTGAIEWRAIEGKQGEQVSIKGSKDTWTNLGAELLVFTGEQVIHYTQSMDKDGNLVQGSQGYDAVSGKPLDEGMWKDYNGLLKFEDSRVFEFSYSKDRQTKPNEGPTPEGLYSINKSDFKAGTNESGTQKWSQQSWINKLKSLVGGGTWPGGTDSWGEYRWQLNKEHVNTTRSSMYLHGGTKWGSRGCIDVGSNIGTLANAILTNKIGNDKVYLQVVYPQDLKIRVANSTTTQLQKVQ